MIDTIDSKIICFLQKDGRMPYTKIADKLRLAEATVRARIQRLMKDEVISIVAVCDPRKLGFALSGNLKLQVSTNRSKEIIEELKQLREIVFIALMAGTSDIDIDFLVKSLEDLHIFLHEKIGKIQGILRVESSIITRYEKEVFDYGTGLAENC